MPCVVPAVLCHAAGERSKEALLNKIGKGKVECEQASG